MKKWICHPCIVEEEDHSLSLRIFKYFYSEMNLPKYQKNFKFATGKDSEEIMFQRQDWESLQDAMAHSGSTENDMENSNYIRSIKVSMNKKLPFIQRIYNWWNKIDEVEDTFDKIKNSKGVIGNELEKAYHNIEKLIDRAKASSQMAIVDKLMEYKNVICCEQILAKNGYDQYVLEGKIIEFFKKCNRGVRIDYIRNYSTMIPFEVIEQKEKLDQLGVFDNYCVMHYDPNLQAFKESQADREAEKRRDPILFGMIKGSRKLYFVADWITDEDDLTLAELNIVVENATSRISRLNLDVEVNIDSLKNLSDNLISFSPSERIS